MSEHPYHYNGKFKKQLLAGMLLLGSGSAWAVDCGREAIASYLKSGFSHEQVVRMCSGGGGEQVERVPVSGAQVESPAGTRSAPVPVERKEGASSEFQAASQHASRNVPQASGQGVSQDDLIFFSSVISADKVELSKDKLVYTDDRCLKYGPEDNNGFKEEACLITRTTIGFDGLQVVRTAKEILFIQDQELIVSGDIQREFTNLEKLGKWERRDFLAEYSKNPTEINIPTRSETNPEVIAARLKLLLSRRY